MSDKLLVTKSALVKILNAIKGPPHYIREIQATANLPMGMSDDNPINILTKNLEDHDNDKKLNSAGYIRLNEVIKAAKFLQELKHRKDEHGKDHYYEQNKPIAWENLDKALGDLS